MFRHSSLIAVASLCLVAGSACAEGPKLPATATTVPDYASALAGPYRSAENRARDTYRHPAETLGFFGLMPDMTVVEVSPGGGWYTELLAPILAKNGTLYAAHANPESSPRAADYVERYKALLASDPVYKDVKLTVFAKGNVDTLAPQGSADMVLTFRNIHNWYMSDYAEAGFKAFFTALKPGGILGIVEHRLPEDRSDAAQKTSGYMKVSTVKALAKAAGFELVESSEINANPKDTADYKDGVWTLPPVLRLGDTDRDKYLSIGESDRMTLKFRKPLS